MFTPFSQFFSRGKQAEKVFSRFTLHISLEKRAAFTLAEVLITLGIIGVVAALTLPVLIGKYRAKVLRTKFLQANTIVQDSVTQMRNDEVDLNAVINKRDSSVIKEYFKNGDCILPKNAKEANYKNYYETKLASGASATILEQPYCLVNGMTLWFVQLKEQITSGDWESGMVEISSSLLAVDINGWQQRPNVYGKDVFFWFYNGSTGAVAPTGDALNIESNLSNFYKDCPSSDYAEAGAGCTSKALSDPYYFDKLKL